jgi:hypothetical protein
VIRYRDVNITQWEKLRLGFLTDCDANYNHSILRVSGVTNHIVSNLALLIAKKIVKLSP